MNVSSVGVSAFGAPVATTTGTQTLTNKTLTTPVLTGQTVAGSYDRTVSSMHVRGGSGGNPILQLSRGSGETASHTFDFALAGGGFSIRDVGSGNHIAANMFGSSAVAEVYAGQKGSAAIQSARTSIFSASTHGTGAGADVDGPNLVVQGGLGNGAGTPGSISFKTGNAGSTGTTGHTSTTRLSIAADTGEVTIDSPGSSSGSVVSVDGTQTLTNKDMSSLTNTFPPLTASMTPELMTELDAGILTFPRAHLLNNGVNAGNGIESGVVSLNYIYPTVDRPIDTVKVFTRESGGAPTLVKVGVYSFDGSGNATLLGVSADTPSIVTGSWTDHDATLLSGVSLVAGTQYAFSLLIVSANPVGNYRGVEMEWSDGLLAPRLIGRSFGHSDMPSSIPVGDIAATAARFYMRGYAA